MTDAFWESDDPESDDQFWADDVDEDAGQPPQAEGEEAPAEPAPVVTEPTTAAEPMPTPKDLAELRARESVLMALKKCLAE